MEFQVLIMFVLRLLAVHGILQVATMLAPQVPGLLRILERVSNFSSTYYLMLVGALVGVPALWFPAMKIADRIAFSLITPMPINHQKSIASFSRFHSLARPSSEKARNH